MNDVAQNQYNFYLPFFFHVCNFYIDFVNVNIANVLLHGTYIENVYIEIGEKGFILRQYIVLSLKYNH